MSTLTAQAAQLIASAGLDDQPLEVIQTLLRAHRIFFSDSLAEESRKMARTLRQKETA